MAFCLCVMTQAVLAGMEEAPYRQSEIKLQRGDTVLLYTDGVTEATSIRQELYGEDRLIKKAENCNRADSETIMTPKKLLEAVWQDVDLFQSGAEQFDDITMLAVKWNETEWIEESGKTGMETVGVFADFMEKQMQQHDISMKTILKIQMAADEILSNICNYSTASEMKVKFKVEETPEGRNVVLCFEDDGIPFNPLKAPKPDVTEPMEMRGIGGLGIYLVKQRMDKVCYEHENGKNCLRIEKLDN